MKALITVFITVFLAELADKTQLATLLFASDKQLSRVGVFLAASAALVLSSAIAVGVGSAASAFLNKRLLSIAAGTGFILIGIFTLVQALRPPS